MSSLFASIRSVIISLLFVSGIEDLERVSRIVLLRLSILVSIGFSNSTVYFISFVVDQTGVPDSKRTLDLSFARRLLYTKVYKALLPSESLDTPLHMLWNSSITKIEVESSIRLSTDSFRVLEL